MGGRTRPARAPFEAQVGLALLVRAAVAMPHVHESVALIEGAGTRVRLERVEAQASRAPLLGEVDEDTADPAAEPIRIEIELLDAIVVEDHEAHDPAGR